MGAGAKGTAAAKSGFLTAWLLPLVPFLGIAAGVGAQWLIIRSTTTDRKARLKQIAVVIAVWVIYLGLAVCGESAMHALGRHFGWSDRIRFVSVIGFWWVFVVVTLALLLRGVSTDRGQPPRRASLRRRISGAGHDPDEPGTLALVVTGGDLMFSWVIRLSVDQQ